MNNYDKEIALEKIENIIAKKIKNNKEKNLEKFKKEMEPLLEDRNKIFMGDKELIKKYLEVKE